MPIPPSSAYVSLETVANLIRVLSNDVILSSAGEILTDTSTLLFPLMNDALEWFTNEINNHGVESFVKETILTPVTPCANPTDPGQFINISDLGYFDEAISHVAPQLPIDLLVPLRLWERQTGTVESWVDMTQLAGGLTAAQPSQRLRFWEWRQDGLYMPGSLQSNDVRLRYTGSHAMFVTSGDTLYFRGAVGAIAYKTVSSYMASKNPQGSEIAFTEAKLRLSQLATRSSRMKQRAPISRQSYGRPQRINTFRPPANP